MRLLPRSIHGRMLALSAIATLAALAIAGVAIAGVLGRFVTDGLDQRLDAELTLLASAIGDDGHVDRSRIERRLAALESGPGWRWRIVTPAETLSSADFPILAAGPPIPLRDPDLGRVVPPPAVRPDGAPQPLEGHEGNIAVHARTLTIGTRAGPVIATAAAPRDVVRRPILGAVAPLLIILAALSALLATAVVVQLRLGLRPLRRLRDDVAAIRSGLRQRVDEDQPDELRPLAVELNALALENAAALAAARASSANLAHALKTPVATLALDVRDSPALATQVARIDTTIRHHLGRARVQVASRRVATPLAPAIDGIVAAVRRLHAARRTAITVDIASGVAVAMDPRDVDELLGNLIDNAAAHASTQVTIDARTEGRSVVVSIADDGPGIAPDDRARALTPGVRLDERSVGHGFGLSIAGELTAIYGGALALEDTPGGGLLAKVTLPRALS